MWSILLGTSVSMQALVAAGRLIVLTEPAKGVNIAAGRLFALSQPSKEVNIAAGRLILMVKR